jgi:hypothetical protein
MPETTCSTGMFLYHPCVSIQQMNVDNCPKNLNKCPEQHCPMYPCWAYDQHMENQDKDKRDRDAGWE